MRASLYILTLLLTAVFIVPSFAEEAYPVRYERTDFVMYQPLPKTFIQEGDILSFHPDKYEDKSSKPHHTLDKAAVRSALTHYRIIPRDEWVFLNHINSITNKGWLILKNNDKLLWILKSSGVGQVIYPDGGTIHLAASPSERYRKQDKYDYLHTLR